MELLECSFQLSQIGLCPQNPSKLFLAKARKEVGGKNHSWHKQAGGSRALPHSSTQSMEPEGQPGIPHLHTGTSPGSDPAEEVTDQLFTAAHKGQDDGLAAVSKGEGQPVPPSTEGEGEGGKGQQHPGTTTASCGNSEPCLILIMEYLD